MKLDHPFYQLDVLFDAKRLEEEVAALPDSAWITHPNGFDDNAAVILVSPHGWVSDEFAIAGAMDATPALRRSPYLRQVLSALQAPISRTRLMRVGGGAKVPRHRDLSYHWYRRTRVHIPVATHPSVRFVCDDTEVHMKAGEAWTFDNFRPHSVENPAERPRIHLVVDTKGSDAFWEMARPFTGSRPKLHLFPYEEEPACELAFDDSGFEVLTPQEVRELIEQVRRGIDATQPVDRELNLFCQKWEAAFQRYGHSEAGEMVYAGLIYRLRRILKPEWLRDEAHAAFSVLTTTLTTTNRTVPFRHSRRRPVQRLPVRRPKMFPDTKYVRVPDWESAVGAGSPFAEPLAAFAVPSTFAEASSRVESVGASTLAEISDKLLALQLVVPVPDRPVFIVSAPRSGSSLLFETLARLPGVWTVGGERHDLIEGLPSLDPAAKQYASCRLTAVDATGEVTRELHARYASLLEDRHGSPYTASRTTGPLRLLDKIPKHALRIPFLKTVFPDARFIVLFRCARDTISSIMEGWRSGRFVTYRDLPGWEDRMPWSFLLPPGWERLRDASLAQVAAFQWRTTVKTVCADLVALSRDEWTCIEYEDLVRSPAETVRRLCSFADWTIDDVTTDYLCRPLPPSKYTLSEPHPDKWRKNEAALSEVLPEVQEVERRVRSSFVNNGSVKEYHVAL